MCAITAGHLCTEVEVQEEKEREIEGRREKKIRKEKRKKDRRRDVRIMAHMCGNKAPEQISKKSSQREQKTFSALPPEPLQFVQVATKSPRFSALKDALDICRLTITSVEGSPPPRNLSTEEGLCETFTAEGMVEVACSFSPTGWTVCSAEAVVMTRARTAMRRDDILLDASVTAVALLPFQFQCFLYLCQERVASGDSRI